MRKLILLEQQQQCFSFKHPKVKANSVWEKKYYYAKKLDSREFEQLLKLKNVKGTLMQIWKSLHMFVFISK